jgi:DGQHR domain-containing protein
MVKLTFPAITARQSDNHQVFSFAAAASQVLKFAGIDRARRDVDGHLTGFQRPQIADHIRHIRDYLAKADAVLPNSVVVAFTSGVEILDGPDGTCRIEVEVGDEPHGLVVDGQQRLTALSSLPDKDFQVFVSALICRDEEELRKQFILINNTRPLPKSLIYELLPSVSDLPPAMAARSTAAGLATALNFQEGSSLRGQIKQHTNPEGRIQDTAIQRVLLNSLSDGICRQLISNPDGSDQCVSLISAFFAAVRSVFPDAWNNHSSKTSRLIHGAGIQSMGYVMELICARDDATTQDGFERGLAPLLGKTAWTSGEWVFGGDERRPWNSIQNLHRDIQLLASFLTKVIKTSDREKVVSLGSR